MIKPKRERLVPRRSLPGRNLDEIFDALDFCVSFFVCFFCSFFLCVFLFSCCFCFLFVSFENTINGGNGEVVFRMRI